MNTVTELEQYKSSVQRTGNPEDVHGSVMLVSLHISQWQARKKDRRVSEAVAQSNGVKAGVGDYYKSLLDPQVLEDIKRETTEARGYHYHMTLPWSDDGPRVLASPLYFEYMEQMQKHKEKFEAKANHLLEQYPYYREEARRVLGSLFRPEDYPDVDQLAGKFRFELKLMPLPKGSDFRCDIGLEEVERVKQQIEAQTREAIQASMQEAYNRVYEVVNRYVDRLAQEDTIFRDSMVENARELVRILPKMNVTGDPELDRLTQVMENQLCTYDPNTLRKNPQARREAHRTAESVMRDLDAFFGPGGGQ